MIWGDRGIAALHPSGKQCSQRTSWPLLAPCCTADPKLAEFLELMAPRSKKATWSNDDAVAAAAGSASAAAVQQAVQGSDDEEYEDLEGETWAGA